MEHQRKFSTPYITSSSSSDKKSELSGIENLFVFKDTKIKVGTIIASFFISISIISATFFSFFQPDSRILTINYKNPEDNKPINIFTLNQNMLYALLYGIGCKFI